VPLAERAGAAGGRTVVAGTAAGVCASRGIGSNDRATIALATLATTSRDRTRVVTTASRSKAKASNPGGRLRVCDELRARTNSRTAGPGRERGETRSVDATNELVHAQPAVGGRAARRRAGRA